MSRAVLAVLVAVALIVVVMLTADPLGFFADEVVRDSGGAGAVDDVREDPTLVGRPDAVAPVASEYLTNEPTGVLDLGLGTAALTGLVTGEGTPLPGARVHVVLPPPAGLRGVRTTQEGRWEIRGLPPAAHEVRATHPEFVGRTTTAPAVAENATAEVETLDLERRRPPTDGLAVKVTDEFGRPIAGARILATTIPWGLHLSIGPELSGTPGVLERRAVTDERGEARLLAMEPESYDVVAMAAGFQVAAQPSVALSEGRVKHLAFRLVPGASISGTVVGPDDQPVAGAYVLGLHQPTFANSLTVRTGEDGRFVLDGLREGKYWMVAAADGKGEAQQSPVDSPSSGLRLKLSGAGVIEVTVTRPDGTPVPRYHVRPFKAEAFGYVYSVSFPVESEDGKGRIEMGPGSYNLSVTGEGGDVAPDTSVKVQVGETSSVHVVLPASVTLTGVVVDPDGRHLADAEIYVRMGGMPGGPRSEQYARSGEDGAFRLTGLPPEVVKLHVEHARFAPRTLEADLSSGKAPPEVTVRMENGGAIEGRVTRGGETPVAGEQVNVFRDWFHPLTTSTDAGGRYRVAGLAPGTWMVSTGAFEFGAGGVSKSGIEVAQGGTTTVDLDVGVAAGTSVLTGVVRCGGQPVDGASVTVLDGRGYESAVAVTTDATGAFRAEGVQPGRVTVQVATVDGARTTTRADVPAEGVAEPLAIDLGSGGVRGRIVMLDDTPVSAAWIQVEEAAGEGSDWGRVRAQITSDAQGVFQAAGLEPGRYQVRVSGSGHAGMLTDPFDVRADGVTDLGTFRLQTGVDLGGRVVDDQGAPVEDATISLHDETGRPVFLFSLVTTGSDGRYAVTGLEPGRYQVGFEARGYAPSHVTVDIGPEGRSVDGTLSRGGTIEVAVVDEAGRPVPGVRLGVLDASGRVVERTLSLVSIFQGEVGRTGEDGVARIPDLAPGAYTLTLRSSGWSIVGPPPGVVVSARQVMRTAMALGKE